MDGGPIISIAILGIIIGAILGGFVESRFWRANAVEHGCASYDPQTGKWGWKQ